MTGAAENGFFDAFVGVPQAGHQAVKDLGETYLMRQVAYKRHPAGAPNQAPLYALLNMVQENHLSAEDIQQIEVSVSRGAFHVVTTNQHPSVNLEIILSLATVFGQVTFDHIFDDAYRADPRYQAFRQRVPIFIIPREDLATRGERLNAGITNHTTSGSVLARELRYPPMTEKGLKQKFRKLAGRRLNDSRVRDLERQLLSIDTVLDVATLVEQLELPY